MIILIIGTLTIIGSCLAFGFILGCAYETKKKWDAWDKEQISKIR